MHSLETEEAPFAQSVWPQDERRIWPPTYEGAPDTLRVVSFEQASKRLLLKLRSCWLRVLESEALARLATCSVEAISH